MHCLLSQRLGLSPPHCPPFGAGGQGQRGTGTSPYGHNETQGSPGSSDSMCTNQAPVWSKFLPKEIQGKEHLFQNSDTLKTLQDHSLQSGTLCSHTHSSATRADLPQPRVRAGLAPPAPVPTGVPGGSGELAASITSQTLSQTWTHSPPSCSQRRPSFCCHFLA